MARRPKSPRRPPKRKPPVASAIAASALSIMTVSERTPDLQSEPAGAVAQAPARRDEEMDEAHNEAATEAAPGAQSVEQAPPVQGMPPGRQIMADSASRDEAAAWWPAVQAAMDTTNRRNVPLLDAPKPEEGEPIGKPS